MKLRVTAGAASLEDRIDVQRARKDLLNEKGSVPWKKVKADLGL